MRRKLPLIVLALAVLAGCLGFLETAAVKTDKAAYTQGEFIHLTASGDGLKFAIQGRNATEFWRLDPTSGRWIPLEIGGLPSPRDECLPSGFLTTHYDFKTSLGEPECRRLLNAEYSWNGKFVETAPALCGKSPYTQYQERALTGTYKAVLRVYNDPGCSSLNATAQAQFQIT